MPRAGSSVLSVVEVQVATPLLDSVMALADRHRDTLGHLPYEVYRQKAAQGQVLAGVGEDGALWGYTVFDIARGRVRLIQLCVDPGLRKAGVARLLVEAVSDRHRDLPGIRVTCRADYAAAKVWPRLDFTLIREVPGRGRDRKPLEVWWRSHGLPDLFTELEGAEDGGLVVAMDLNVFLDLSVDRTRSGADESQVLTDDWLATRISLALTPETLNELQGLPVASRRAQRAAASAYSMLTPAPAQLATTRQALGSAFEVRRLSPSDLAHVVQAAAGGARVLVTRDQELIDTVADAAQAALGLGVMRPSDLALHIDELENAERYRPAALRGTGYQLQETSAGMQQALSGLLSTDTGERRAGYSARLREVLSTPGMEHQHVRDSDGRIVVAWSLDPRGAVWLLPYLRAARVPLAPTVLRLLVFDLKRRAVAGGATGLRVTDPHCGPSVTASLEEDGFKLDGYIHSALLLDARSRESALARLPEHHDLRPLLAAGGLAPTQLARLEQSLWPAKFLDGPLGNYVVSIQPRWADDLFSLTDTLLERASILGLSREHVYYRSAGQNPAAPARLLWYASGSGKRRVGAVVATSQLVEVVTAPPRQLFRRFAHLGVYRLEDIESRARRGVASALRFVDTERFARPVSLERLRALGVISQTAPLLSPTKVTAAGFGAVYREGTGRGGY